MIAKGLRLFTVNVRRGAPDVQDQKLNSHSKLNCILASIQATQAAADEALMLDPHGFVATCNSTHFFIVRNREVWTSSGKYCLGGITRGNVIELCREAGIPVREKNFSLTDVYGAEEAFVTGTFAGVVPVRSVDGRKFAEGRGPMTNLHLGGRRGDPARCRAAVPTRAWLDGLDHCVEAARLYRAAAVGVDLLFESGYLRHYLLEVNAFGDFFPGLVDAHGQGVHRFEIRASARAHGLPA